MDMISGLRQQAAELKKQKEEEEAKAKANQVANDGDPENEAPPSGDATAPTS
jgi:hypothetical protein